MANRTAACSKRQTAISLLGIPDDQKSICPCGSACPHFPARPPNHSQQRAGRPTEAILSARQAECRLEGRCGTPPTIDRSSRDGGCLRTVYERSLGGTSYVSSGLLSWQRPQSFEPGCAERHVPRR